MAITYDPGKERRNLRDHRISLTRFAEMDPTATVGAVDDREDYGEERWILIGPIDGRPHVAVVTYRDADTHIISLRRATRHEEARYHGQNR